MKDSKQVTVEISMRQYEVLCRIQQENKEAVKSVHALLKFMIDDYIAKYK